MDKQQIIREYLKAKAGKNASVSENEKPSISYIKLTFILLIIGISPVILLIISYPLMMLYKCHGQIGALSCSSSWVTSIAEFTSGLSWFVFLTAPAMFVLWVIITVVRVFKFTASAPKEGSW